MERRSAAVRSVYAFHRAFLCACAGTAGVIALGHGPALAAPAAGTVEGVARDASGRPLADAEVRLLSPDGKVLGTVKSGPDGAYRFTGVGPGAMP